MSECFDILTATQSAKLSELFRPEMHRQTFANIKNNRLSGFDCLRAPNLHRGFEFNKPSKMINPVPNESPTCVPAACGLVYRTCCARTGITLKIHLEQCKPLTERTLCSCPCYLWHRIYSRRAPERVSSAFHFQSLQSV